jgi:hypothetical protein
MRYRKKPVVIDAVRFSATPEGLEELKSFCDDSLGRVLQWPDMPAEAEICTLEDGTNMRVKHIATEGDWIIRGVRGELYPCRNDIFMETYESA